MIVRELGNELYLQQKLQKKLEELLNMDVSDLNQPGLEVHFGETPLMLVLYEFRGDIDEKALATIEQILMRDGFDILQTNKNNYNLLYVAVANERFTVAKKIIEVAAKQGKHEKLCCEIDSFDNLCYLLCSLYDPVKTWQPQVDFYEYYLEIVSAFVSPADKQPIQFLCGFFEKYIKIRKASRGESNIVSLVNCFYSFIENADNSEVTDQVFNIQQSMYNDESFLRALVRIKTIVGMKGYEPLHNFYFTFCFFKRAIEIAVQEKKNFTPFQRIIKAVHDIGIDQFSFQELKQDFFQGQDKNQVLTSDVLDFILESIRSIQSDPEKGQAWLANIGLEIQKLDFIKQKKALSAFLRQVQEKKVKLLQQPDVVMPIADAEEKEPAPEGDDAPRQPKQSRFSYSSPRKIKYGLNFFCVRNCLDVIESKEQDAGMRLPLFSSEDEAKAVHRFLISHFSPKNEWDGFEQSQIQKDENTNQYYFVLKNYQWQAVAERVTSYHADFKEKLSKIRALLWLWEAPSTPLSAPTIKYVRTQLRLVEDKDKAHTLNFKDITAFENNMKKLPMPIELKVAIAAFTVSALLLVLILAVPGLAALSASTVAASGLAIMGTGSGSMWFFKRKKELAEDQAKINIALELNVQGAGTRS